MSKSDDNTGPASLDNQSEEDRVRRFLGLKTSGAPQQQQRPEQARQRHKFIADGAVPVVMLNRTDSETVGLRERMVRTDAALEAEKQAHAATKRSLQEAQAALTAAQTRLQHAEMAHRDALTGERDGRRAAEQALEQLRAEAAAPRPSPAEPAARAPVRRVRTLRKVAEASSAEQKPVRWWTPSYRAKKV